jgi:hypothetical protein
MRALLLLITSLLLTTSLALADPNVWKREWPKTDFTNSSVKAWDEILSGGPPKDGIPSVDDPKFYKTNRERRLEGREPVITLAIDGQAERAYPIRYLIWHEIVNDTVGGVPIAVTFCPLCNSGITFDRRTPSGTLTFGVSGKLRNSDMIMFDRETESWWQQAVGTAILGQLNGTELKTLPSWMESWDQFKARNGREGLVMKQPNARRDYGRNPYRGYDTTQKPFLYSGEMPPNGISPVARVVRVGNRAWPVSRIREKGGVSEAGVKITWEAGQASALDTANIAEGREVGTIRVRDAQGRNLAHDVMFAFAFHAFWPDGTWMDG